MTKFFTGEATAGSRGEASREDLERGYSNADADEMPDDGMYYLPDEGGGFLGRARGWER